MSQLDKRSASGGAMAILLAYGKGLRPDPAQKQERRQWPPMGVTAYHSPPRPPSGGAARREAGVLA